MTISERIEALIEIMTPDEIQDGLRFVEVLERGGTMTPDEAAEWRRRILARRRFLELGVDRAD